MHSIHMHFWCYRKIEQAHSLHFPSRQEPSLPSASSFRELIGLNVAEWGWVPFFFSFPFFCFLCLSSQPASFKHKRFLIVCPPVCFFLFEGLLRSMGDGTDEDKIRKVRSLFTPGPGIWANEKKVKSDTSPVWMFSLDVSTVGSLKKNQ